MKREYEGSFPIREAPRSITAAFAVAERLCADILNCTYPPGSKLRFESLKKDYGVGFSPLREALSRLVTTQLVTTDGQRGFRVPEASVADITDIAMVRTQIEGKLSPSPSSWAVMSGRPRSWRRDIASPSSRVEARVNQ